MKVSSFGLGLAVLCFSLSCTKNTDKPSNARPAVSGDPVPASSVPVPADSPVGKIKLALASSSACPGFLSLQLTGDSAHIEVKDFGGAYFTNNGFSGSTTFTCEVLLKATVPALQSIVGTFSSNQSITIASKFGAPHSASFILQSMFTEFDSTRPMSLIQGQIANLQGPLTTTADYSFQPVDRPLVSRCSGSEQSVGIVFFADFTLMRTESADISEAFVKGKLPKLDLALKPCSL